MSHSETPVSPEVVREMRADALEVLHRREPVVIGEILNALAILGTFDENGGSSVGS